MDGLLDTIVHRSTHNTRILGKPIVILPRLEQRMIEVEFCSAERLIYSELKNFCVETLNGRFGKIGGYLNKC